MRPYRDPYCRGAVSDVPPGQWAIYDDGIYRHGVLVWTEADLREIDNDGLPLAAIVAAEDPTAAVFELVEMIERAVLRWPELRLIYAPRWRVELQNYLLRKLS